MFSSAVKVGIRFNDWKTKPILRSLILLSSPALNVDVSSSLKKILPEVGLSTSPSRFRRVVFPEPFMPTKQMMSGFFSLALYSKSIPLT